MKTDAVSTLKDIHTLYRVLLRIGDISVEIGSDHPVILYDDEAISFFRVEGEEAHLRFHISSFDSSMINHADPPWDGEYYHNLGDAGRVLPLPASFVERFMPYMEEIASRDDGSSYVLNEHYFFGTFMTEGMAYLCYNASTAEPSYLKTMFKFFLRQFLHRFDAIMFHSSSVVLDDRALLFCGPTGAGKSTVLSLLNHLPVIADDHSLIRKRGDGFIAYGTPFGKEAHRARYGGYRVGAVYFLIKSRECYIRRLTPLQALCWSTRSDQHIRHHLCYNARGYQFDYLCKMFQKVPVYELGFRKEGIDLEGLKASII